jgi:hypothetical protein
MERGHWKRVDWAGYGVAAFVLIGATLAFFRDDLMRTAEAPAPETHIAPPPQVPGPAINRWREAAKRVEEDRGEKTGRAARVRVPPQLLHYADKRRFLAIQVAGWREENYELPHDEAGLAVLIQRGELIEVKPVTDDYVLYGVGANATGEPLSHFDRRTGREITLYPRWDAFDDARFARRAEIDAKNESIEALRAEFRKTSTKTRAGRRRRTALNRQVQAGRAQVAAIQRRIAADAAAYDDYDRRKMLVEEWDVLQAQAAAFGGREYDLEKPEHRRAFRARLLSHVRPEALEVMSEIARQYREQFGRPLAFTSLVRSEHYQLQLGETNANATKIAVPPHTTGLAFDIFYRYMTADEQHAIMGVIARMEAEGRLEALRENRDHFHLFAFARGRRPPEHLIAEALGDVRPIRIATSAPAPVRKARTTVRGRTTTRQAAARKRAAPKKATPRKPAPRKRRR